MSEPRPKSCQQCQNPVALHLSKVVNGQVTKLGLCASCPQAAQLKGSVGWDLIAGPQVACSPAAVRGGSVACPGCGLTASDFKETGRLGCARCYETFESNLASVIARLHKGRRHVGKAPRGARRETSPEELATLKRRLAEHVSREEFELAAALRDQLKSLEK